MTGKQFQELAMRTQANGSKYEQLINGALGLTGEAGECADMIKKYAFQGHSLSGQELLKELGDVLWYVALMCEGLGTTMDTPMEMVIEKLKKRYPDGFKIENSVNREEN